METKENRHTPSGHYLYELGMYHNDELAPRYVQTHRETDRHPGLLPVHSHPFFELAWVRSCDGMEYFIGGERYLLRNGDILFIPPGVLHGAVLPQTPGEPLVRDVVWISPHLLNHLDQMHPNRRFYETGDSRLLRTEGTPWAGLGELFQRGITEREKRQFGWESMVLGNTMQLLTQVFRAMVDRSLLILREEKSDLLMRVLDYTEGHLGEKLTLESVAREFDVSRSTITQMFRKKLDVSFYSYLTRRRLTHAKSLIAAGVPLEQVGKQVGFKEHSAFYRAFRQEYGISPREYKQSISGEGKPSPLSTN